MRKVVIHRPGSHPCLELEEHPDLEPGPGEVLVETRAAGVNFADVLVRMGLYSSARHYVGWPITPGFEFSGPIAAVGDGVDDLDPGAEVFGVTRFGGYATQVVVPRSQVLLRPAGLTAIQAAAFPTVALTAYYALHELARIGSGDWVLVHSAAGGVGGMLVQLARIAGAHVVGVVGAAHKRASVEELGAEGVIVREGADLWSEAERLGPEHGYDIVLDASGVATLKGSYDHLAPAGRLVVYGFHSMLKPGKGKQSRLRLLWNYFRTPRFDPLRMTGENRSVLAFNLSYLFDRQELLARAMEELLGWVESGQLRPPPVQTLPLDEVAQAHQALESGRTIGKLALLCRV